MPNGSSARRIRRRRGQLGFSVVGIAVTVTVAALVIGLLTDILIVSLRKPKDPQTQLAPADAELAIARFVSRDVLPAVTATPRGNACGITQAALVTAEKSVPTAVHPDQDVAYSLGPDGLTRSTCSTGATLSATTTLVSPDVIAFTAVCAAPGACGTVHVDVETEVAGTDSPHHFTLDINHKQ
jgi:hypothetical protein